MSGTRAGSLARLGFAYGDACAEGIGLDGCRVRRGGCGCGSLQRLVLVKLSLAADVARSSWDVANLSSRRVDRHDVHGLAHLSADASLSREHDHLDAGDVQ